MQQLSLPKTTRARYFPDLSIIVPTFHEAANLQELIERIDRVRQQKSLALELIIVDDNSCDGTQELIGSLKQPWIRLIVRKRERGLSSAVICGLEAARGDVLMVMDADLSHPPEAIPALLERLAVGADFVIGSRYTEGGSTDAEWGAFRWLNSRAATLMARPFTKARDPMAGFFALRRRTFARARQLNPIGYKIGLELMVKCGCRRVEETPIHFADRKRGQSKLSLREQVRYIRHLGRLLHFRYEHLLGFLSLLLVIAAFVLPTVTFLPQQSYFIDETTQLSGLTLGPVEVTKWLAGHDSHRFGVPPDRAPPLSYWVGWIWSKAFGLTEASMRWLGVLCVGVAIIIVFHAARRAWGIGAALAAGLFMALSPNVIVNAVEIRSYPMLLLFSSGGFACLVGFCVNARRAWPWLAAMALCSILATYTHFFGLLLTGALFTAALVTAWSMKSRIAPVCITGALAFVAGFGLWPFVAAAVAKSGADERSSLVALADFLRYIYRGLFGHPAMATSVVALAGATLAFAVLAFVSLTPKRHATAASRAVFVALTAGMGVAVLAGYAFTKFDSLHASYNLWRAPAFALLLGSALAARQPCLQAMARIAAIVLVSASGYGAWQLMVHGDYFSHGPHRRISQIIENLGADNVSVIHDGGSAWGKAYFPIEFAFQRGVTQYLFQSTQSDFAAVVRLPGVDHTLDATDLPARHLVVIQAAEQSWSDVSVQLRHGDRTLQRGPVLLELEQSNRWRSIGHRLFVASVATELHIFQRADDEAGSNDVTTASVGLTSISTTLAGDF